MRSRCDVSGWFTVEEIDRDTYAISEYGHSEETHCYLLCGDDRCLLIDTGLGVEDISTVVRGITEKPVIAAATHIHWDHIGGYGRFDTICVHSAEIEWLNGGFPLPNSAVRKMLTEGGLPNGSAVDDYKVFQGVPSRILTDGEKIELGGRTIEVLHTPGHSPGHMCFWEEDRGGLFTGDLIYKGILYANYPSTDPKLFLSSVRRIARLTAKRIFPGHHTLDVQVEMITSVSDGLESLKKRGLLAHGRGKFDFEGWSILL